MSDHSLVGQVTSLRAFDRSVNEIFLISVLVPSLMSFWCANRASLRALAPRLQLELSPGMRAQSGRLWRAPHHRTESLVPSDCPTF